ncbi:SusD/RagB family nutrient-binding outer membrane lipoprotein [Echinicola vietnamensis]|uniref:Starch-binding associating with outer membrane n=1 Tax=Echinicola vietnamensis (strain DSM 17526 / LMG 23754 / KMM 6221) TaxID=926556 RepID=L0FVM9_ECHVK|nr:SusD/RagB family nutrient-binding outer membrane lipoprotein [Echinicola vietnamensis]AGA77063.1 hypothetical protein Echvi_0788 [Echinicola vietnamensis DSM 17526]
MRRLINKINTGLAAGMLVMATGCSDFGDMNVNPNKPSTPLTSSLLTDAQRSVSDVIGNETSVLYVQHISQKQYTEGSRYQTIYFNFNGYYSGPMFDLERIIDLNTDEATKGDMTAAGSNANQIAVARILKAYFYSVLTDRWGELPYTEALQGDEDLSPAYDTQKDIYYSLFTELTEAVAQMDGGTPVEGDFLLEGDMEGWEQFANSLRLTLALRLSDVDPAKAEAEFVAAYEAGILETDLMYPYLAATNNQNPWYARFLTRVDHVISSTMVDFMKPLDDPRLGVYADPAAATGTIEGMPYGISNAVAGEITNDEVSYLGSTARQQDAPLPIMTRSQLLFSLAEGAARGWIDESAEDLYYEAIQASFEQWGVFDQASYDTYIAQPEVMYDSSNPYMSIGNQKWAALFLQGFEAWAEWRRLDYPELTPAPDALNESGQIPVRQAYPTTERDLNEANYAEAVARQGEDGLDTKLWWDVN